jgi:hypothetical protein
LSANDYLSKFKFLKLTVGLPSLIPGFSYLFLPTFAPPLLSREYGIVSSFVSAVLVMLYFYAPRRHKREQMLPVLIRRAALAFVASIICLIFYLVLLRWCTVTDPRGESRLQIGFGRWFYGLTTDGQEWLIAHPSQTLQEWVLSAGFREYTPELFWKPWTIYTSGALLLVVFFAMCILWSIVWGLITKQLSMTDGASI